MDKKILIVIAAVIIIVVAGIAAVALSGDDDDDKKNDDNNKTNTDDTPTVITRDKPVSKSFDDTRLRIYGNANGDDVIDANDKTVIQYIIDCANSASKTDDVDWEKDYPFADANQDGKIDSDDLTVIDNIINKQSTKMYYYNFYGRVTYVNYPIGQKVGAEYLNLQLLPAIHKYDLLTAVTQNTVSSHGKVYPGISDMISLGDSSGEIKMETLADLYLNKKVDTLLQWTGGQNSDYLWDNAVKSGLANKISFVIVPCQGPNVIQGVLELACMLGDQSLSDDYKAWYDKAINMFDQIDQKGIKKTITCVKLYNNKPSGIGAFGGKQGPALWFNKIVNFQDACKDKTNFYNLGSIDSFNEFATDEVIVMTQKKCDWSEYNSYVEQMLKDVYSVTNQYKNGKMYVVDFEIQPFSAGPAGCYILAAHLYPELYNLSDALAFLQEYLDNFAVRSGANANEGYTYTGTAFGSQ